MVPMLQLSKIAQCKKTIRHKLQQLITIKELHGYTSRKNGGGRRFYS